MRIALVAEDYYPQLGGVPEHVHHLALELNRRGHATTVVTAHMRGVQDDAPFVLRVGTSVVIYANGGVSRITIGWRLVSRLAQLFEEGRFDVVHVHGGLAPTFGLAAPLAVYCDVSLKSFAEVVPAAGSRNSALRISPDRIAQLTGAEWVDVCKHAAPQE